MDTKLRLIKTLVFLEVLEHLLEISTDDRIDQIDMKTATESELYNCIRQHWEILEKDEAYIARSGRVKDKVKDTQKWTHVESL